MNWIGIITNLLTAVNVLVCFLIVLLVLLQRPKNEGLGAAFGGDTASNIFGAQTTNVLATLTRWMGSIFLVLCLVIAVLGTHDTKRRDKIGAYLDKMKQEQTERDKQKAAKDAAMAASAAVDAAKKPAAPTATPPQPAPLPPSAPAKLEDKKPAPAPAVPAPTTPNPPAKPAEKPAEPKAADQKPADAKPAGGN